MVALPGWLPPVLLAGGMAVGTVFATLAAVRAQRGADSSTLLSGRLLGLSWISGFAALFLTITGLSADTPDLATVLWPAGLFWLLAVAGGAGYVVAIVLEHRRLTFRR